MCGIAGFVARHPVEKGGKVIHDMLTALVRRGPDGTSWLGLGADGNTIWEREKKFTSERALRFAFGCSRLAIQDPTDRGLQPIASPNGKVWVVLNGEIFNFIELRQELMARGGNFRTGTDTEVVAAAYQEYGVRCFEKFNGQFSIGIFDQAKGKFILARDRLGITPLYLYRSDEFLSFGSEILSIRESYLPQLTLSHQQVAAIIGLPYKLHWIPESTLFREIEAIKPGHFVEIDLGSLKSVETCYWNLRETTGQKLQSIGEAKECVKSLLLDSVRIRMRSDRPLAFIVSGGVDSSTVLGIATQLLGAKVKTFSLDIPTSRFNEKKEIQEVLDYNNVAQNFISVEADHVVKLFPEVVAENDQPLATPNAVLHGLMARRIHESGIRVVLNGVGGDEVFLGYHDHFLFNLHEAEKDRTLNFDREYSSWLQSQGRHPEVYSAFKKFLSDETSAYSPDFLARSRGFDYRSILLKKGKDLDAWSFKLGEPSPCAKQMDDLTRLTVPHSIKMDDACYLSRAVETRQPFLDHRLIEFGVHLPTCYKIRNSISKFVLRQAFRKVIPSTRRRDQRKIGLNFPIDDWFRTKLRSWVRDQLHGEGAPLYQFADYAKVQDILRQHEKSEVNHSLKIWDLISVNHWLKSSV